MTRKEATKIWKKNNPEKVKEHQRRSYLKHREKLLEYSRWENLKSTFGLSKEEYYSMLCTQKGCCLICGKHQSKFKRNLAVDHCHTTGRVRGLLCTTCNSGLGIYEKYKEQYEEYLKNFGETFSQRYANK